MGTSILTGKKAKIAIGGTNNSHSVYGISEFSIVFNRGTNEQPLLGAEGNEYYEGPLSIEGSLTCCKFAASGNSKLLDSIVSGSIVSISGAVSGSTDIRWFLHSCQVTSYNVSAGDAGTISEASIDFVCLNPHQVSYDSDIGKVND